MPEGDVGGPDVGLRQISRGLVFEGLIVPGPDGRPTPRLAERWAVTENGLGLRLHLRPNVRFHDGTPLTAATAAGALQNVIAERTSVAFYPNLLDIESVIAEESEGTVLLRLKRRSSFVLDDLVVPLRIQKGDDVLGTGPYVVTKSSNSEIVLAAHDQHHMGKPNVRQVVLRSYPTLRTAWAGLMRGEIDMVSDVPHDTLEFVENERVQILTFPRRYQFAITFNSRRAAVASPVVRRALNAAVDREGIIRTVLKGNGLPAAGPIWPNHWAYDRGTPVYSYDPSMAEAMLQAAGLHRRAAPGAAPPARLRFKCLVPHNFSVLERIALIVQKQLYDVGIDMQLEAVSADELNRRLLTTGDFDAAIMDMISGPGIGRAYQFWRSPGEVKGLNVFGYSNADADRWFDAVRAARDEGAYRSAVAQLARVLIEDPPALFLAWNERARAVSRRFEIPDEAGRDPLFTMWQWKAAASESDP